MPSAKPTIVFTPEGWNKSLMLHLRKIYLDEKQVGKMIALKP